MASKPSPSRQHKHLAVLIDADNASVVIAEDISYATETRCKPRAVYTKKTHTTFQIN